MRDLRDFFFREVNMAMEAANFDHWLIRNFLVDLLERSARWSGDEILVVRKDPAIAFQLDKAANPEQVKELSKKLLFVIGFFPENLSATGKRTISLGYYIKTEESLLCKVGHSGESVWNELAFNLKPTIKSLHYVRANTKIKQPGVYYLEEIKKEVGDISAFYKL